NLRREASPLATLRSVRLGAPDEGFNLRREASPLATSRAVTVRTIQHMFQSQARSQSSGDWSNTCACRGAGLGFNHRREASLLSTDLPFQYHVKTPSAIKLTSSFELHTNLMRSNLRREASPLATSHTQRKGHMNRSFNLRREASPLATLACSLRHCVISLQWYF